MLKVKPGNKVKMLWWFLSLGVVILLIGGTSLWLMNDRSGFNSLEEERQEVESTIIEIAAVLNIDTSELKMTQRECTSLTSSNAERVDFGLAVEVETAPSTTAQYKVERILNTRGWKTERRSSATTEDVFATRNSADLTISTFSKTRVSIASSTTCYS